MELFIKIAVTIFYVALVWGFGSVVVKIWGMQIDPRRTAEKILDLARPEMPSIIASRDPDKLYQNGKAVGVVHGNVSHVAGLLVFDIISDTPEFDRSAPVEYQRQILRFVSSEAEVGQMMNTKIEDGGVKSTILTNVISKGQFKIQ